MLSPDDEFADFETWDSANFGDGVKTPDMLPREYARPALKEGLRLEAELGEVEDADDVVVVEARDDLLLRTLGADDPEEDMPVAQVRGDIDVVHRDQRVEIIVAGDDRTDLALEEFADSEQTLAHGGRRFVSRPTPRGVVPARQRCGLVGLGNYSVCSTFSSS